MARRIRWQIVIAAVSSLFIVGLLGRLALSTTAVSRPLAGGTYIEAVVGAPVQPIPLLNDPLSDPAGRDLGALLFDGLTRIGPDGLPEPALAESWQVDTSGEVYTFNLRRDVTWHDGTPFTAGDVVFTVQAIQDVSFSGDPALANLWRNVLVDRLDNHTVRFTLNAPYAPFLSSARLPILPVHLLGGLNANQWAGSPFAQTLVGTGPYILRELTGERALLEANPDYFLQRPFIDQIELRFIATPQAALSALARGEVQTLGFRRTRESSQVALPRTVRPVTLPLDEYVVLTFNLRNALLDEPVLRRALATGLNKDALIAQALDGQAARIDTPILPGWWAYNPDAQWHAPDQAAAERILSELGYELNTDGVRVRDGQALVLPLITDNDPGRLAVAEEIVRQWETIGVRIAVIGLDSTTLRQRLRDHDFVLALHGWARLGADPDVFELWHSSQAATGSNYAGLRDEEIDTFLLRGRTERELAVRSDNYAAFQERWIELTPSIILYQPLYTFAVSEQVDGIGFDTAGIGGNALLIGREDRYRNITRWFVNSAREIRGNLR